MRRDSSDVQERLVKGEILIKAVEAEGRAVGALVDGHSEAAVPRSGAGWQRRHGIEARHLNRMVRTPAWSVACLSAGSSALNRQHAEAKELAAGGGASGVFVGVGS